MGHRQTQHMGRSEGDDRDLAGRDAAGREDEALEAGAPEVEEARRIQELVDGARGEWTASSRGSSRGSGRGSGRRGSSGR